MQFKRLKRKHKKIKEEEQWKKLTGVTDWTHQTKEGAREEEYVYLDERPYSEHELQSNNI